MHRIHMTDASTSSCLDQQDGDVRDDVSDTSTIWPATQDDRFGGSSTPKQATSSAFPPVTFRRFTDENEKLRHPIVHSMDMLSVYAPTREYETLPPTVDDLSATLPPRNYAAPSPVGSALHLLHRCRELQRDLAASPLSSSSLSTAAPSDSCASVSSMLSTAASMPRQIRLNLRTTVILRNLPLRFSSRDLLQLLDGQELCGTYDFVYLPVGLESGMGVGYGLVNFVEQEKAELAKSRLNGIVMPNVDTAVEATWSTQHQGYDAHVARYRNSGMMHESAPDDARPMVFANGERIAFPPPTRRIRAPYTPMAGRRY